MSRPPDRVLRLDGSRKGWVGVFLEGGRFAGVGLFPCIEEALVAAQGCAVIGVDMPLGLLAEGSREADLAAREALGPRRSSLFLVPPRPVLEQPGYAEANALAKRSWGQGLTRQAWNLTPRILELDPHQPDPRLHEVHPELAFAALLGAPSPWSKKSWGGQRQRLRALSEAGVCLPDTLPEEVLAVPPDDLIDAAAVAWSATRIARGQALSYPAAPTQHDRGRPIVIRI